MEYIEIVIAILGSTVATSIINYLLYKRKYKAEGAKADIDTQKAKRESDKELVEEWEAVLDKVVEVQKKAAGMAVNIAKLELENKSLRDELSEYKFENTEYKERIEKTKEELEEIKNENTELRDELALLKLQIETLRNATTDNKSRNK